MAGRKSGRPSRRSTEGAARTSTPQDFGQLDSDSEMADASIVEDASEAAQDDLEPDTPAPADEGDTRMDEEQDEQDEEDDGPVIQPIPRKRRGPGRPPRIPRPEDFDDDNSDGTPRRKRGPGRPPTRGRGGWRGGARNSRTTADRAPIDREGNTVDVINDEADLPEDEAGEAKVDKDGKLLGGRDYRVRVFTIKGKGDRLYMLSTEPARCTGFRDSYLFFNKHLGLFKIIVDEDEKMDLIDRDVLPHSYKGRSIGVVTARSVFREFGARIIIGGKRITDDYYEEAARERGDVEGEIADPNDRLPPAGDPYNKNQYVAWHGASQVYHTQPATSSTMPAGKRIEGKRRTNITAANWQLEHANEAKKFNSTLTAARRAALAGVYDTHTNLVLYPRITQPTHARWTPVPRDSLFPAPASSLATSHLIADTLFESPAETSFGVPGPAGDAADLLIAPNGLAGVGEDLLQELPADCREAFEAALAGEQAWKTRFSGEQADGHRAALRIGYAGFPV